jgi:neopullulanase
LSLGKDIKKLKMALAFLLTTRGIPELYYGTELLMDGDGGYHPNVRKDFPGGWPGDQVNAFNQSGRTAEQNEIFDFMKTLLAWRKTEPAIHKGKLTHYIPGDNIYVYFRHTENKTVMIILNANNDEKQLDTTRFSDHIKSHKKAKDIVTSRSVDITSLSLSPWGVLILDLE